MSEDKAPLEFDMTTTSQAMDVIQDTLEAFLETASVDRVYGEPIPHGESLLIPTSEVLVGMGFGAGYGAGSGMEEDDESGGETSAGGGGGGGGGGRTLSRPVAVIVASPEGVQVEPVVDITKLGLAFLTAGGFVAATMLRMLRPAKALKQLKGE